MFITTPVEEVLYSPTLHIHVCMVRLYEDLQHLATSMDTKTRLAALSKANSFKFLSMSSKSHILKV